MFKVGDKVRCIKKDMFNGKIIKVGEERTVAKLQIEGFRDEENAYWLNYCFELAEQPKPIEPQVGDVWGSGDKSKVVRVLGEFKRNGFDFVSYLGLKGECKGVANFSRKQFFFDKFPTLLYRPQKPKKQPKPQPKKKDGWEIITKPYDYGFYNFGKFIDYTVYKKHNKIKAKTADGIVGYAICSPSDEYDFNIGFKIASTRMKAKWFEREAERLARGDK